MHELAASALLNRTLKLSIFKKLIIWGLTGLGALISRISIIIYFTMCDPPEVLWKISLVYRPLLHKKIAKLGAGVNTESNFSIGYLEQDLKNRGSVN